jgi:hypothetical protein
MRNRLSPFGRLYSELLKPSSRLPTFEQLVERKESIEAGCFAFSLAVSPSLVLPVVGEVTTGGACLVGGLVGGLGLGWAGHQLGRQAGENIYHFATQMQWSRWWTSRWLARSGLNQSIALSSAHPAANALQRVGEVRLVENGKSVRGERD